MSKEAFTKHVPDERIETAPTLPKERPATKREVWERYHAIFFDRKGHRRTPICTDRCNHRNPGELETFCREAWAWYYVSAFNFHEWRKQPEWVEGDPVIPEAVPDEPFAAGETHKWAATLASMMETAARLMPERREKQLEIAA